METDAPSSFLLTVWLISMFCILILHLLTKLVTGTLNEALEDQNSFLNLLTTTANYVAMVDDNNRVVYISKSLSELAKIEVPELARGQYFVDLFLYREIKLLAANTLSRKENFTGDWEFTLDGQKRYFRVISNSVAGAAEGYLINLQDLTTLAERDEIAVMKDSLEIGFFFMTFLLSVHFVSATPKTLILPMAILVAFLPMAYLDVFLIHSQLA